MLLRSLSLPACLVVAAATLAGCCASRRSGGGAGAYDFEYPLPAVERGTIVAEVAAGIAIDDRRPDQYVALSAAEAQCLAAEHSAIGNLLEREKGTVCRRQLCKSDRCEDCLRRKLLDTAAREARNKNAADALRLYYGLAETESGLDLIGQSEPIVDEALAKANELKRSELTVPFDRSEWERQQTGLAAKRAELLATRAKLNAQLRTLLGYASTPDDPYFWPADTLAVNADPLDAESEVGYGSATRPHLVLLRELSACGHESVVDVVRELLGETHGLLGLKAKVSALSLKKLLGLNHDCEPCARSGQLQELSAARENQIAGEIRAAVRAGDERRRAAALLDKQIAAWTTRVDELEQKRAIGDASYFEAAAARIKLLEARQAVVAAAIEFRRAEVDLHEAQGALEAECRGVSSAALGAAAAANPAPPAESAGEMIPAPPIPSPAQP